MEQLIPRTPKRQRTGAPWPMQYTSVAVGFEVDRVESGQPKIMHSNRRAGLSLENTARKRKR